MIVNHTINKVINSTEENTESLLDLTSDSVSPENLLLNKTAHNSEGEGIVGMMPEGGTSNYDELENRPQINSNLLTGNKTGSQLGLQNRVLASTLNIGGQTIGNVEGALSALNESKSDLVNGKVPVNELPVYQPVIGSIQSIGGIVPPSSSGDEDKYLRSDGTWAKPAGGGGGVSDYDDLTNRPKVNGTTLSGDKTGTQLGLQNIILSSTLSIGGQTVTEVEEALGSLAGISKSMTGATSSTAGEGGFVPSPSAGDENKALFGDGTWKPVSGGGGGGHTILDEDGTTYPQRSKLQFEGCEVTDDAVNGVTVVKCEGGAKKYAKPTITVGTYTYNGTTQAPTITGFDANVMTLTGTYEATNAGSYTFTIALSDKTSSKWTDDTQDDIVTNWSIDALSVAVPTVTNTTKTYNGSAQSPTITRDTANTSISGTTSATKVKSNYSFSIALTDTTNHKWSDNTTAAKSYTWKINPPTGSSYTPVNNIQAWLQCASIDKTYTTIAQVLADATTLSALMLSNNAVDYLVRSTEWAKNDGLVPVMTSYTTPSGEVLRSTNHSSVPAWKAFDGDDSTFGAVNKDGSALYIGYHFTAPTVCTKVYIKLKSDGAHASERVSFVYKIQGSTDGTTWTDLTSNYTISTSESEKTIIFSSNTAYSYYRIYSTTGSGNDTGGIYLAIVTTQFYAYDGHGITEDQTAMTDIGSSDYCADTLLANSTWRQAICDSTYFENVLTTKSPNMTSNTTPSGTVSASYVYSGRAAWWAFDGGIPDTNTGYHYWWTGTPAQNLSYTFDSALTLYKVMFKFAPGENPSTGSVIKFQYSSDNSTWTDLASWTLGSETKPAITDHEGVFKSSKTKYYRFLVTKPVGSGVAIGTVHLYGRA